MDSNFSSALRLTDLNDFITPSQECIKPVEIKKKPERKGLSKIQIANDGDYMEVDNRTGKATKLKKAEVNFNFCEPFVSSVVKRVDSGAGGLGFDYRAAQIEHRVVNVSPPLRHFFETVLLERYAAEMTLPLARHFSLIWGT